MVQTEVFTTGRQSNSTKTAVHFPNHNLLAF